jgi:glycerol uptake facilitator-like aquaporin
MPTLKEQTTLGRRLTAEALGTALLLAAVVGSGIMAERLSGGNFALALLSNTIATGAALLALILTFGPISGAHFNPIVSLSSGIQTDLKWPDFFWYTLAQTFGAISGVVLANVMFDLSPISWSGHERGGSLLLLSEFVASFGLVAVIISCARRQPKFVAVAVAAYITAAYWFTPSTSFANPAVTIARAMSDSFAGIAPRNVPGFIAAQVVGGISATMLFGWLVPRSENN